MDNHEKCSVSHCKLDGRSRRDGILYCGQHYQQAYRGKDPSDYVTVGESGRVELTCLLDDCDKRARLGGLCGPHAEAAALGNIEPPEGARVRLRPMCAFSGCENRALSHKEGSLCRAHAQQRRNGAELRSLREWGEYVNGNVPCMIEGCDRPARTRELCITHYQKSIYYRVTGAELQLLLLVDECQNPGCHETERLGIDHNHSTGAVRDVLCSGCNTALGLLGESPERAAGLIEYMWKHA